ncbi:MAG TPA: tripartite tricarboxylate transporter substrate-binding protein [Burkholderiales bacterium]|nr:tripartite tricarboxylate transporter substrate-binding protein [Burkholderiales bacterium]
MRAVAWCAVAASLCMTTVANAQTWKPQRNVELIVPSGPGSAVDLTTRELQRRMQALGMTDVSVTNKVGGAGALAWSYMNTHQGDAHYLATTLGNLLTNPITGAHPLTYKDITPVALLFTDYISFTVRADSPLKTGADFVNRLKKDPTSVAIGIPTALGGLSHTVIGAIMKPAGVDARKLKIVVFKGGGDAGTALLGGHIDIVASAPQSFLGHLKSGAVRMIAVNAPQRQAGELASVPTWQEQGYPGIVSNWRGVLAPRGLSAAQLQYWEDIFQRITSTEDWKAYVEKNVSEPRFMKSAEFRAYLDEQDKILRSVLTDLGLAK